MTPTVGRSVHYFPVAGGTPLHAVITRVFGSTCVNLDVSATNTEYPHTMTHQTSVALRDDPSQTGVWDWPDTEVIAETCAEHPPAALLPPAEDDATADKRVAGEVAKETTEA